ncbi:MAG: hypothetical protein WC477_07185 [Patescibacteria group bacterium]
MNKTDEMVKKCFGEVWFTDGKGAVRHYSEIARSARRFVRMEQREKRKKLMATLKRERKSAVVVGELPENFGKMD